MSIEENPLVVFHTQLYRREPEFLAALPKQITPQRFMRVVMTAVQSNLKLLECDRQSFFNACMKAAQDGLYPDGRYGVILPYNCKVPGKKTRDKDGKWTQERDSWVKAAEWTPMILGVYQKLHNSGVLKSINAYLVHEADEFEYCLGDDEKIVHRPRLDPQLRLDPQSAEVGVYAIARTTNGGIYREVMSTADVERNRAQSKAPDSPAWEKFWGEMAKKTCVKRLAKRLPLSADDLDFLYREDDEAEAVPPPALIAEKPTLKELYGDEHGEPFEPSGAPDLPGDEMAETTE